MSEKEEQVLKVNDAAASMDSFEETKRPIGKLSDEMSSVCYTHSTDFWDLKNFHGAGSRGELAKLVYFLLCDPPCNVRHKN